MTELPPEMHPDELRALREKIAANLQRLEQIPFAKSLDDRKETQSIDALRTQLDATAHLIDDLGKTSK